MKANTNSKKIDIKYIAYFAVGIILLIAVIVTGKSGLSQTDKDIYAKALELDESLNGVGFNNFVLSDYKVRFFDGNIDYVVNGNNIEKEKAAYETFVGTTVDIDGEYQVLLPVYDRFSQMFDMLSTAGNLAEGNFSFGESDYSTNAHIATLWHESFHTWQFTNYESEILAQATSAGITKSVNYADVILNEVDNNDELKAMFIQEMSLLQTLIKSDDIHSESAMLNEILTLESKRSTMMSSQAAFIEKYYQTIEGSAKYVESNVFKALEGNDKWVATYLKPFEYTNGSGKYYDMGMLKCMILDQLSLDWKASFDPTVSLNELLRQAVANTLAECGTKEDGSLCGAASFSTRR